MGVLSHHQTISLSLLDSEATNELSRFLQEFSSQVFTTDKLVNQEGKDILDSLGIGQTLRHQGRDIRQNFMIEEGKDALGSLRQKLSRQGKI